MITGRYNSVHGKKPRSAQMKIQQQQPRDPATARERRRILAMAVVGMWASQEAEAFVSSSFGVVGRTMLVGLVRGRHDSAWSACRRRPAWLRTCMTSDSAEAMEVAKDALDMEEDGAQEAKEEMLAPPDREAALKMLEDMEDSDASQEGIYNQADEYAIADAPIMPMPPYFFEVPGEQGKDDLCTDPEWQTALLALKWLGFPVEVRHNPNTKEPRLLVGEELYDNAKAFMDMLPQRVLLSDFVESLPKFKSMITELDAAWQALFRNGDEKREDKLQEKMHKSLEVLDKALGASKGIFLEGDELTIGDLDLSVTIYHMMSTLGTSEGWSLKDSYPSLGRYVETMHDMEFFTMVMPSKADTSKRYSS